jgi:UDP-N-acetylglucosamine 2-epimerase (non-hydrolysing)
MRIVHVVGVRPNFIKIAPLIKALSQYPDVEQLLIHTGQHFDDTMSKVFFEELDIPAPLLNLDAGSASGEAQTGHMIAELDKAFEDLSPDCVVVVGDVNSTLAAAIVAAKKCIPCVHVEAGLRSFDRTMPEEINRIVTDHVADLLLTPSEDADANLVAEGLPPQRIERIGNVMVDTLLQHVDSARNRPLLEQLGFVAGRYGVVTLHRPSNVDDRDVLEGLCETFEWIQRRLPLVVPLHPRTRERLLRFSLLDMLCSMDNVRVTEPLGYLDFLSLVASARIVLTDSGGLQEETTVLGVSCVTLRARTERPVTVSSGTNTVVGSDPAAIRNAVSEILNGSPKRGQAPPLWDGKASERAARHIVERMSRRSVRG